MRRWLPITAVIVVLTSALVWGADLLRPSVRRDRVRTARVESGPLEASLTASGTVVPAIEHVISSPIDARVLAVLRRVGDQLKAGDPIVRLDTSDSELEAEKLRQNIALKGNEQARTRLTLESQLIELDGQIKSKDLELQALKAALASNQALSKEGLVSQEALRESELKAAQAAVDLGRLKQSRVNAEATNRAQLEGLSLEMQSLHAEDAQQRRLLELTTTKSDRNGVLTFVQDEEGRCVRKGDVVARIADLTAFRVEATTSDVNASRIRIGQPVSVRLDDLVTTGRVSVVEPQMQNGALQVPGRARPARRHLAALEPARRRAGDHRPQGTRAARRPRPVRPGRRRAAGVRAAQQPRLPHAGAPRRLQLRLVRGRGRPGRGRRNHRLRHARLRVGAGAEGEVTLNA